MQVSPKEIEDFIQQHASLSPLITDIAVAGVITSHSSRTNDEKVPRAWLVLSSEGKKLGKKEVEKRVKRAVEEGLSRYKSLRGGVGFVDSVSKRLIWRMATDYF